MKKYLKFVFLVIPLISSSITIQAQDKKDFELLDSIFEPKENPFDFKQYVKGNTNEMQWIASGLFLFYKSFISSQDRNHCVFHPSCSVYAIQSIKKKGFILGLADGMDRLSRCNRLSGENYTRFENTNLFYDPVW